MQATRSGTRPATGPTRTAEAWLLVMVVIWAVNFSVIKVGLAELTPFAFNGLRYPLAAGLLAGSLVVRGRVGLPERRDALWIVGLGILGHVFYQLLFIQGMDRTTAGNGSLLLATAPIYTALLSGMLEHDTIGRRAWLGIIGAFVGIALVVAGGSRGLSFGSRTVIGDMLILAAAVLWALYTVGARDLVKKYGSLRVTTWVMWIGAAALFALGLPEILAGDRVPLPTWGAVAYSGLLGIGLAQLLWYRGVQLIGSTRTSTFQNLVPVLAILVAWLWLGEIPTAPQLIGAAVILGGISVVRRSVSAS